MKLTYDAGVLSSTTRMKNARKPATLRAPVYSQNRNRRIISVPNGLWVVQELDGVTGKWHNVSRHMTFIAALARAA